MHAACAHPQYGRRGGSGNDAVDGGLGGDSLFGETGLDVATSDGVGVVVDRARSRGSRFFRKLP
jgi:hypothetical protein